MVLNVIPLFYITGKLRRKLSGREAEVVCCDHKPRTMDNYQALKRQEWNLL